jgi:hypothetical protein
MKIFGKCGPIVVFLFFSTFALAAQDPPVPQPAVACGFSDLIAVGVMVKFDKNGDGLLDLTESLGALPEFVASIKTRYGVDWVAEAAYTFSMKHERFPGNDIVGVSEFTSWIGARPFWSYNLTLEQVTKAITAILCRSQP